MNLDGVNTSLLKLNGLEAEPSAIMQPMLHINAHTQAIDNVH
jgi:hypothetical protein